MNASAMDAERFPTLTEDGRRMLKFMREHPAAPLYRNQSGNKLTQAEVNELRLYEALMSEAPAGWRQRQLPDWLPDFVARTFDTVPYYRKTGSPPLRFEDIAPVSRADLARDIAQFVPDDVELDRLINFSTTGTTGHPMLIASHPVVAGRYLAFHKRALRRFGIHLTHGKGQVGVVLLGHQRKCFTYVSVTPTMDESGLAKINLHPAEWKRVDDRAPYLDALAPEVIAGDPISFAELLTLPLSYQPRALISVSMTLLPGLRHKLEARFGCPVLDIYSLNEVGPVAVFDAATGGHVLLQPELYIEILDADGRPVHSGERGEIAVTGGFNFCLPLLRYRTGDYASLSWADQTPVIVNLSGRSPVRFRGPSNTWINNIDVTHALHPIALSHFTFFQAADGSLRLRIPAAAMRLTDDARAALEPLFGQQSIQVELLTAEDKTVQYASALEQASDGDAPGHAAGPIAS
jgi:phenylacetate-CoA ligase